MVQLLLMLTARPGLLQQTIQAMRSVSVPARLEGSAISSRLSSDVGDRNVLYYVEEWPDVEGLKEFTRSPRFAWMLAVMETAAEAPTIELRFVSEVRGLDYIAEVRGESRLAEGK